ncbi:MAG TPA: glycosyltransferase family 39 protein [Candidatus Nanoarchaeia archaeon]|nr:glycosyltransferase family 39 protein [Candidatus Nanoarchaeia archaeon]
MIKDTWQKASLLSFLLFIVLFLNYLLYPVWLVFEGVKMRILYFLILAAVIIVSVFLFRKLSFKSMGGLGKSVGSFKVWAILFGVLFLSQAILLTKPLTYPGDEDYHIGRAAYLYKPIENGMKGIFGSLYPAWGALLFLAVVAGLLALKHSYKLDVQKIGELVHAHFWKIIISSFVLASFFFGTVNYLLDRILALQHPGSSYVPNFWILIRYTPMPAYLFTGSLLFFGYKLFFIRLSLLVLVSLTAFFLFKTIQFISGRRDAAWFGGLAYLFLPNVFYYSGIAFIDPALDLFMMASAYFFLRYLKERKQMYVPYILLFMVTGFFFKDFIVVLYGLFLVFLGLSHLFKYKKGKMGKKWILNFFVEHKFFLLNFIIFLLAVLPWIFTAKSEGVYYYDLHVSNIFSSFTVKMFWHMIPEFTVLFFFLFVAGLLYFLFKGKQVHRFIIFWFIGFFCFHAMHIIWNKDIHRYSLHYTLPALILGVLFLYEWVSHKKYTCLKALPWVLVIFLVGSTLFAAHRNADDRYVPFDGAYQMLAERMENPDKAILVGMRSVTYMAKYGLNWDNVLFFDFSNESKPVESQSVDRLYNISLSENITYILTSDDHPAYGLRLFEKESFIWGNEPLYLNEAFIHDLVHVKDPRFCLLGITSHGVNQVYLFRIVRSGEHLKGCLQDQVS